MVHTMVYTPTDLRGHPVDCTSHGVHVGVAQVVLLVHLGGAEIWSPEK